MDWLSDLYDVLRPLWVLWLMLIFLGIVAWALWPGRRKKMKEYGEIPLRDDEGT